MLSGRQEAAAAELARWWDGLRQPGAGPRAVLLEVPAGWGRTAVLDQLAGAAGRAVDPAGLVVRIGGRSLPGRPGAQALALQDLVLDSGVRRRAAGMLCAGWRPARRGWARSACSHPGLPLRERCCSAG